MDSSKVCVVFLLALLGVALALAGGSVEAAGLAGSGPYAAALHLMTAPSTTTAASTVGFEVRRRVLSSISSSSLNPNQAACLRSCPAPGGAYTGRSCQKVYQCSG